MKLLRWWWWCRYCRHIYFLRQDIAEAWVHFAEWGCGSLSIDTGKVVDVEVMSRYCQACVTSAPLVRSDPDKFDDFQAHHKPDCRIYHMGSVSAMEGTINIVSLTSSKSFDKKGQSNWTFKSIDIDRCDVT